jgi:hypothetical protein
VGPSGPVTKKLDENKKEIMKKGQGLEKKKAECWA